MSKRISCFCITLAISFLSGIASASPIVKINFPANNATVQGPVYFSASASSPGCSKGIAAMRIYSAPSVTAYTVQAAQFSTFIHLKPGTYNAVVQAWDNCGGVGKTPVKVSVSASGGVTIYAPVTANGSLNSPIHFVASAASPCSKGISAIRVYPSSQVNAYTVKSDQLDTFLSLPIGTYNLIVQAFDNCGKVFRTSLTLSAQDARGRFLYMATFDLNYISEYSVDPSGFLSPAIQYPVPNGPPQDFVVDGEGKFAYATVDRGIEAFTINQNTGALTEVAGSPFPATGNGPYKLAMDPQRNFIYVTFSNSDTVSSYRIDRNTGALKSSGNASVGNGAGAVKTDPSGKFLYISNSIDNTISAFAINWTTGALTTIPGSPFPSGVNPSVFAVSNKFLYLFGGGSEIPKTISGYFIDTSSGALTPVPGSPFPGHGNPANYIAVDAVHNILYQTAAPGGGTFSDSISVFRIDPTSGTISFEDTTAQFQEQNAETLLPDFSGRFLYMVDNFDGGENSPSAVGSFAIDPGTGNLSPLGAPFRTDSHNAFATLAISP
ncbi:MAG TPA: beta-propeller fold lactonase family protein [Terriglobales bacterium]|nr:beta-propeller fold lactonase family protein [Terriglobales bacterium]